MMWRRLHSARAARVIIGTTAAIVSAAVCVGLATGPDNDRRDHEPDSDNYTIALFGDMPYNELGRQQYPALLADINARHVAFSVFDGDLKAGGDGPCADAVYTTAIDQFNTLQRPLVWLPGASPVDIRW